MLKSLFNKVAGLKEAGGFFYRKPLVAASEMFEKIPTFNECIFDWAAVLELLFPKSKYFVSFHYIHNFCMCAMFRL